MALALIGSVALGTAACSHNYALHFAHESIGHISCEDLEMVVYDWDKDPEGMWTWRVACGSHRYRCYGGSGSIAKCADTQKTAGKSSTSGNPRRTPE